MDRWRGGWLVALLCAIRVFTFRSDGIGLLNDSDTIGILKTIRERHDPLSWFGGDWPLANHFYRPISTLFFEFDNWWYRDNAFGYGTTSALLCSCCVLLTFWFLRELTDKPSLTITGTIAFTLWHFPSLGFLEPIANGVVLAVVAGGVYRHRKQVWGWLMPGLLWLAGLDLFSLPNSLNRITLHWLPGRTATVMTVFCLTSLAAYARYERLASRPPAPDPTPLDPPATRSTKKNPDKASVFWPILSLCSLVLALGAYEQAVMLPACLLAVAVTFHWRKHQVHWQWQVPFWLILGGYLAFRYQVIPHGVSRYQAQQFRNGPGVAMSLIAYGFPSLNYLPGLFATFELGPLVVLTAQPYFTVFALFRDVVLTTRIGKQWLFLFAGWGLSLIAYLPMAWLQQFDHYHYWPLAMRSLFIAGLLSLATQETVTAWSRPKVQAPPRLRPAPGSLPHP